MFDRVAGGRYAGGMPELWIIVAAVAGLALGGTDGLPAV